MAVSTAVWTSGICGHDCLDGGILFLQSCAQAYGCLTMVYTLKRHGLTVAPQLAIGDGSMGFWLALQEEFSLLRQQRCWTIKRPRSWINCARAPLDAPTG